AVAAASAPLGGIKLPTLLAEVLHPITGSRSGGAELLQFRSHTRHPSIAPSLRAISTISLVQKLHWVFPNGGRNRHRII
ncbi:MAG: hypothetical protein ABSG12_11800, partial [Steroidobacteraceae bacterium]